MNHRKNKENPKSKIETNENKIIKKRSRHRKRKKTRKSKRKKKLQNKPGCLILLHGNPRSAKGKQESIEKAAKNVSADIVTLNETLLTGKNKMKIPYFTTFTKNRDEKQFGGISTSVHDDWKEYAVCVGEGEGEDEFHSIRLSNFSPPVTVVNNYGEIEGRNSKQVVARWARLKKEMDTITGRGEHCLLVGDLNKHVGNDDLGVQGNHDYISPGGRLMRDMVQSGDWFLVNNMSEVTNGGPFTRVDPASGKLSCLDYVMASAGLRPYVISMVIDSARKFAMERAVFNRKTKKYETKQSDHFSFVMKLANLPTEKQTQEKEAQWNLAKPGGWSKFKELSKAKSKAVDDAVEDDSKNVEEVYSKFEAIENKIKFQAFGKRLVNNSTKKDAEKEVECELKDDDEQAKTLLKMKQDKLDNEMKKVRDSANGRVGQVFKIAKLVQGSKKDKVNAHAIKHPITGALIVSTEEIKKVSVEYCKQNLRNNDPHPGYQEGVKMISRLHNERMEDNIGNGCMINEEEFWSVLDKFKKNNKRTHDFLMKSSKEFQTSVFHLCQRMLKEETFPKSFQKTTLQMIWKKKMRKEELKSNRMIHSKQWLPRTVEALAVSKMKPTILSGTSCFQIGGRPGHRPQEHLFVVKSILLRLHMQKRLAILNIHDIEAFFDRERLDGVCNTLYEMKADKAAIRCWAKLNEDTVIRCITSVGKSEWVRVGPLVGQGSSGASLASAAHLDHHLTNMFSGCQEALSYGDVLQAPYSFQDDVMDVVDSVESMRSKTIKMDSMVKQMTLDLHPDKCCFILYGTNKQKEEARQEVKLSPIERGSFFLKEKFSEKWLGDILCGDGVSQSAMATISDREGKLRRASFEIVALAEDYRAQLVGGFLTVLDLWTKAALPSLLYNCSTWMGLSKEGESKLNNCQDFMLRLAFRTGPGCPTIALRSECGLISPHLTVWEEKVKMIIHIRGLDASSLARRVYEVQKLNSWPGLAKEVSSICEALVIEDANNTKEDVKHYFKKLKEACRVRDEVDMKKAMTSMEKMVILNNEDCKIKDYIKQKSINKVRDTFATRVMMLKFAGNYSHDERFRKSNWLCEACDLQITEDQVHITQCSGYTDLKVSRDIEFNNDDLVSFYQDVLARRDEIDKEKRKQKK